MQTYEYLHHPHILDHKFIIHSRSPLFTFIHARFQNVKEKSIITMRQIMNMLKEIIAREQLFDKRNPCIIICEKGLEHVFHARAIHLQDVKQILFSHVIRLPDSNQEPHHHLGQHTLLMFPFHAQPMASASIVVPEDGNTLYTIMTKLWSLFRTSLQDQFEDKDYYSLKEVMHYSVEYINYRGQSIRAGNILVLTHDPLGDIFQVDFMHKNQLCSFVQKCIYAQTDSGSDAHDDSDDSYRVEYTLGESEESHRPSFVGGESDEESGSSDPLEPCNQPTQVVTDNEDNGDNEEDEQEDEPKKKRQRRTCLGCGEDGEVLVTHCSNCWQLRKQWLPKRNKKQLKIDFSSEQVKDGDCTTCQSRMADTTFVHGRTGHCVCCWMCAKKIWNTKKACPICHRSVEKLVKIFK